MISPVAMSRGREERGRAVALVVVAAPLRLPGAHRQEGLGTVQGLDLALFVDTENQGTIRRRQIQTDDVADLLHEEGIARQLEGPPSDAAASRRPARCDEWSRARGRSPAPSSEGSNGSRPAASLPASAGPLPRWRHRRFDAARRGGVRRTDRRGPPPHSGDATCPRCPRSPRDERRSPCSPTLPPPPRRSEPAAQAPATSCDDETAPPIRRARHRSKRSSPPLSPSIAPPKNK